MAGVFFSPLSTAAATHARDFAAAALNGKKYGSGGFISFLFTLEQKRRNFGHTDRRTDRLRQRAMRVLLGDETGRRLHRRNVECPIDADFVEKKELRSVEEEIF